MQGCRLVDLLILGQAEVLNIFSAFHYQENKPPPLPADWLFCLLYQWGAYTNAICKEFMWKKRAFAPKLFVYRREIKGLETFFRLILSEKN